MSKAHEHNPPAVTEKGRGIRIQKAMAQAGVASRRDCETLVTDQRVRVNGHLVKELPAWVDPSDDRIEVDGKPIAKAGRKSRLAGPHKPRYLMINKPKRVISTNDDPKGRKRLLDLVDIPMNQRLFPVGRLDFESTGLILLTNDGQLANRLTHPSFGVAKQYRVTVRGKLDPSALPTLRQGLLLTTETDTGSPKRAAMESVRIVRTETDRQHGDRTLLDICLREGQNREIRRLLARLGYKVRRLQRTAIGPVRLKGIPVGGWRNLTPREVQQLHKAANHLDEPRP